MEKFIVSNWFEKRAALNFQTFEVAGVEFELMALTEALIEDVTLCESYEEMLCLAADAGISYNRKRVADDVELSKDLTLLWGLDDMDIDADPCIKYRVGEEVCSISGLESVLADMLKSEQDKEKAKHLAELKEQGYVDGDRDTPSVSLGQLDEDAAA